MRIGAGRGIDDLLADYPYLDRQDILEALRYAAWRSQERVIALTASAAAQLILVREVPSPISDPHILMTSTTPICLMRLAQQAAGASIFWTFALEVH